MIKTTNAVTIDNIDIAVHNRYAKDQEGLDPLFLTEPQLVAPHSGITGMSNIYSSKWEELFDIQKKNLSWAHFSPPDRYFTQSNRFFSYCLLPDLYWHAKHEDAEDEEQSDTLYQDLEDSSEKKKNKSKRPSFAEISKITSRLRKEKNIHIPLLERDQAALISLLQSIDKLNDLLAHVQSRMLQYQKG